MSLTRFERKARDRTRLPVGRPRDVLASREPNGRAQRKPASERQEEIMATALNQPHRKGDADPLLGFALGRLLRQGQINADQFATGKRYGHLAARHMEIHGFRHKWPSAALSRMVGSNWASMRVEPEEKDVEATEQQWEEAMGFLADQGLFPRGVNALARLCLMDVDPMSVDDLGTAREALNVLHRKWG